MTLLAGLVVFYVLMLLVGLAAILSRHAIPDSPKIFHVPLLVSVPASVFSLAMLAYIVVPFAPAEAFGRGWLFWCTVLAASEIVTWGTLNVYGFFYYHLYGAHHQRKRERDGDS